MAMDVPDMNPGKTAAQAAHAAQEMTAAIATTDNQFIKDQYRLWCEDRAFGTTIVLEAVTPDIISIVKGLGDRTYDEWGIGDYVIDPTYPFKNYYGEVFTSSTVTCGWLFLTENTPQEFTDKFRELTKLHR